MKQSHFLCTDSDLALNKIFPDIAKLFVKNNIIPYDEHNIHEDAVYYDTDGLKLLRNGGHCKVVSATEANAEKRVIVELRKGKKFLTSRLISKTADISTEELSKIFSFNKSIQPIIRVSSDVNHIYLKYTTPTVWFGNLYPHFDLVTSIVKPVNEKFGTHGEAIMFSFIDRTSLLYNTHTANTLSDDIDYCLNVFDNYMKKQKAKRISSHIYHELLDLSHTAQQQENNEEK